MEQQQTVSLATPVLVETTRSGVVESQQRGMVCVMDQDDVVLYRAGNIERVVFPRSALKYMQVLPFLESGAAEHFGITDEEIAVMCASHNAEPPHLKAVRSILAKAGLSEADLNCGAHAPMSKDAAEALVKKGESPTQIHNNCSGKHAGFLALAKFLDAPLENYLSPEHPVQVLVREAITDLCQIPPREMVWGIDGCSAPNYGMPLRNLAIGFLGLTLEHPDHPKRTTACKRVIQAVSTFPFMVAGTDRYCTDMMNICAPQIIGKLGAAGIYCLAFPEHKIGVAIKMEDGATGPQYNVVQKLISEVRMNSKSKLEPLEKYYQTPIHNYNGMLTGHQAAKFELFMKLTI